MGGGSYHANGGAHGANVRVVGELEVSDLELRAIPISERKIRPNAKSSHASEHKR